MHIHVYLHNFRTVNIWDNPVDNNSRSITSANRRKITVTA